MNFAFPLNILWSVHGSTFSYTVIKHLKVEVRMKKTSATKLTKCTKLVVEIKQMYRKSTP